MLNLDLIILGIGLVFTLLILEIIYRKQITKIPKPFSINKNSILESSLDKFLLESSLDKFLKDNLQFTQDLNILCYEINTKKGI